MPGGDRTGPLGLGPGTGRALGYCYGYESPGYTKWPGVKTGWKLGKGMGPGRGLGRGLCHWLPYGGCRFGYPWIHSTSRDDEIRLLKSQAETLSRTQKNIEKRLKELEEKEE